jgi:hypothetical protein
MRSKGFTSGQGFAARFLPSQNWKQPDNWKQRVVKNLSMTHYAR